MRAAFYTLGCKVNQYESEVLAERFRAAGWTVVPFEEEADCYVINTCSVTAVADSKSRAAIRRARRRNPAAVVAVAGCYPQTAHAAVSALPEVDVLCGTAGKGDLLSLVEKAVTTKQRQLVLRAPAEFEPMEAVTSGRTRATLKIQDGCNNFCSYCIIPYARGRERSKPAADCEREFMALARRGFGEIVLTGIEVSSYGHDTGDSLIALLTRLQRQLTEEGLSTRIRLSSLDPRVITPAFVEQAKALPALCPHYHLSLQSGCAATLRRMNRHYTPAEFASSVELLRRELGAAVTTDVITGFPGETEEEFAESLAFIEQVAFAKIHVFPYSRRPGTVADRMEGQLPRTVKDERAKRVAAAGEKSREAFLVSHLGQTAAVLAETKGADGRWEGYTPDYVPVRFTPMKEVDLAGKLCMVSLTEVAGDGCLGLQIQ